MKNRTLLWLVIALVVFGGGAWMAKEANLFLSPRAKQLAYLKEHEEEMANFIKSRNPKVESAQFDWDSMEVGQIGNGTPQGGGYMLTFKGRINNIKESVHTFLLYREYKDGDYKLVAVFVCVKELYYRMNILIEALIFENRTQIFLIQDFSFFVFD